MGVNVDHAVFYTLYIHCKLVTLKCVYWTTSLCVAYVVKAVRYSGRGDVKKYYSRRHN